jgi:hypothetical protein
MAKSVIFLLIFAIIWTEASSFNQKLNHLAKEEKNSWRREPLLQAKSGISRLSRLNTMSRAYEVLVNRRNELKKQEMERKKEVLQREESMRRRIYEQYLLSTQGGSNVLKDFYTIRF